MCVRKSSHRLLTLVWAVTSSFLVSACSGDSSGDGEPSAAGSQGMAGAEQAMGSAECAAVFDAGGGWEVCDQVLIHRKTAGVCPMMLPERSTRNDGLEFTDGTCSQDRHCTERALGYCQSNRCVYRCRQDSDCSQGEICFCVEQTCIASSCTADGDCSDGQLCEATQPTPDVPYTASCQ